MLNFLLPNDVKVNITIDDIRLRPNLTTKTLSLTEKSFLYTIIGFTQSHSDRSNESPKRYIQTLPGRYKSKNPINIHGSEKIHSKCDCINGTIVNGLRKSILFSFALNKPPGQKIQKELRIKLFKKINKSIFSHITFYLEDDVLKSLEFISRF